MVWAVVCLFAATNRVIVFNEGCIGLVIDILQDAMHCLVSNIPKSEIVIRYCCGFLAGWPDDEGTAGCGWDRCCVVRVGGCMRAGRCIAWIRALRSQCATGGPCCMTQMCILRCRRALLPCTGIAEGCMFPLYTIREVVDCAVLFSWYH